jgi:drug/metabolite transporter (DMT)-like permease
VLASWERRPEAAALAAGVSWAVIAMLAFGGYYIPMHTAAQAGWAWAAFVFRLTSTLLVLVAWLALRPRNARRGDLPALASIGVLDTGGNIFFAAAASRGLVSVVSILASLYPVATVLLARAFLHERVHRTQELGIGLTLAGIVLVSAG